MKFNKINSKFFPLLCILFVASLLTLINLGSNPPSLNWDEVSHGYNAYSILQTGKDEWGVSFPMIFRAFGDYKLPVYIYSSIFPVSIFGLNEFSVRLVSALAGIFAVWGVYLLSGSLFPEAHFILFKKKIPLSLLVSGLLVTNPWHFFISRPALEANLALTLVIFGGYFLVRFFQNKSSLLPSLILFGISLHTYNTERVFVPLLILFSFLIFYKVIPKNLINVKNLIAIVFFCLSLGVVVNQVCSGEGSARYEKLKILSPSTVFQIGEQRQQSSLPPVLSRFIYNKPIFFTYTVIKNYLGYFSPSFFYQTWGAQFQFAVPKQNLLTLPVYLLFIVGSIIIIKDIKKEKAYQFIFVWLLLSPVAASLTIDPPQALRPNPMIPAIIIIAGVGLMRLTKLLSTKTITPFLIIIFAWILVSFSSYVFVYYNQYRSGFSSVWQYGYKEIVEFVVDHKSEYQNIFITKKYGEPHIFYAFYSNLSPLEIFLGADNLRYAKSDWYWTDRIGNVYFVNDWQIPTIEVKSLPLESGGDISTQRSLLITSPDHIPVNAHIIKTVKFLNGSDAFIITSIP